jgi:radical SAM protein with 4Fe4S-binding SPASM domain
MATINKKILNFILYHHTIKKISNFLLSQNLIKKNKIYQYFLQKQISKVIKKNQKVPSILRIENTNFCNGKCFMCPYPNMKRKKGTMNRKLYKKIIDQASNIKIKYLNLHNFGEPLIDKDFAWKVKYAKSKNIKRISTNTNGTLLTPKLTKDIINSDLDEIYISVDAATQKTYKKIRIGLDYNQVQKNIKYLVKLKKQLKKDNPKIILDFLEFDLNKNETNKFINKWKKIVDNVCISQIHDWSNKKQIKLKNKINNYVEFSQTPCRLPFTEMLINWDGTVSLCCQDIDGEVILGDTKKDNLIKIWQNKKYQNIRRSHQNLKTNNLKLCKNCKLRTFWWSF